jgi:hypothetical protein
VKSIRSPPPSPSPSPTIWCEMIKRMERLCDKEGGVTVAKLRIFPTQQNFDFSTAVTLGFTFRVEKNRPAESNNRLQKTLF